MGEIEQDNERLRRLKMGRIILKQVHLAVSLCLVTFAATLPTQAQEDPHYLEYKRSDGSSEYYGDINGNRVMREQYVELGKAQIQTMQNNVMVFAMTNQAAADTYGDVESKKIMAIQQGNTAEVVAGLEKSKQEFVERIEKHESKPTFQCALVSMELSRQSQ